MSALRRRAEHDGPLSTLAAAADGADRAALVSGGEVIDWRSLALRVQRAMDRLRGAPRPFCFTPRRTVDDVATILACVELGVPFLPLHPRLTDDERATLARRTERASIPAETLAVVPTSGSSGAPKLAVLSRGAFLASAEASAENLGWRDDDRWLLAMPLSHVGGLSIVIRSLAARRAVVLAREGPFDASRFAEQLARGRVTVASVVPTMLHRLLALGPAWSPPRHLRAVLLGGAPASPALLARADDRGVPVLTTYGLTEMCSQVTTQPYGTQNRGDLGAGPPVRGAVVRIVEGEILVGGPMRMDGYLDTRAPFTPEGLFPTGDLGALDARGNLHVHGRRSDRIVTGGENVDPLEVEHALERCPGVRAACVVGIPDPEWGELVAALVVADATPEAVVSFAREHLAPFKRPRRIAIVAELPLTASGKPDRIAARRHAERAG